MIAAATPMRTSVNAKVVEECTTTRSQAAIKPIPPARTAPLTAAIVGRSVSIRRSSASDERAGVGGLVGALLEVGAGAERRAAVGEHDGPGVLLLGGVDPLVQLGDELARQRVAVLLRVERDRRDAIHQLGPHDSSRVVSQILSHCRTVPGVHERGPAPVVSDPRVAELLHSRT